MPTGKGQTEGQALEQTHLVRNPVPHTSAEALQQEQMMVKKVAAGVLLVPLMENFSADGSEGGEGGEQAVHDKNHWHQCLPL